MADFVTVQFSVRMMTTIMATEIRELFISGMTNRQGKHYDLTEEDIMADNGFDNQKNVVNFVTEYIKNKIMEKNEYEEKLPLTHKCNCCGKKFVDFFDNELCDDCENYYFKDSLKEDNIKWYDIKYSKNKVEKDLRGESIWTTDI